MNKAAEIQRRLDSLSNPMAAVEYRRFFKTGPGEYGDGDVFRGINVPSLRKLAKECRGLSLKETQSLLKSSFHEDRTLALIVLTEAFAKGDARRIYELYLANTAHINNWDLVDISAPQIVGGYLLDKARGVLLKMARSKSLWERRIAIVSTLRFIRAGQFDDTFRIAQILLADEHDLIHKATGWMLREAGKRDIDAEERFLKMHCHKMPRTMLRYAIERFPEERRMFYLKHASKASGAGGTPLHRSLKLAYLTFRSQLGIIRIIDPAAETSPCTHA